MTKSDKLFIAVFNDYYGRLLTEQQCEVIKLYYDCDMSLAEIAEEHGVSRQAIRDSIVRAENLLVEAEQKLGFVAKIERLKKILADESVSAEQRVLNMKNELEA